MSAQQQKTTLPLYIYGYFFCQAINLTAAVISVSVAATVGSLIAPSQSLATLPYGLQFLAMLLVTYPVSIVMTRKGRNLGFVLGACSLLLAGLVGYWAVVNHSFMLLMLAHVLLGAFTACANYYRFAAVDRLSGAAKSKAVSLVVAGGLVAAVLGPSIASMLREVDGFALFSLSYGALSVLALVNLVLIFCLPKDQVAKHSDNGKQKQQADRLSSMPKGLLFAVMTAAFSFGVMNLIMIQSSLQMHHSHVHFDHSSLAIQWHVVAMFAPSFILGRLLTSFGHQKVITAGFVFFMVTALINNLFNSYAAMVVSLICLGLAWNFTYVGGSALISVLLEGHAQAKRWQGIGDTGIAFVAMLGAMTPALLMSSIGWQWSNVLAGGLILLCLLCQWKTLSSNRAQEG
ncbi:MFS transporter [Marinomonas epiphytica]